MSIRLFQQVRPIDMPQSGVFSSHIYPLQAYATEGPNKLLIPKTPRLSTIRRLVVWVPEGELDEQGLAGNLWRLANPNSLQILFIGFANQPEEETKMRQRMVMLKGFINDFRIRVGLMVISEPNWLAAISDVLHHDDLLIVCQEQTVPRSHIGARSLGRLLCEKLDMPVYLVSGLINTPPQQHLDRLRNAAAWASSIALILIFGGIQISLQRAYTGPLASLVLGSSIIVEFIALLKVNELIG